MKTGDPILDFSIEAGPRVITPDTPDYVVKELAKYKCFSPLREAMRRMTLRERSEIIAEIKWVGLENRKLEKVYRGTGTMLPDARIPKRLIDKLEAETKEAWNPVMREDTLRCYPELRLNVKG